MQGHSISSHPLTKVLGGQDWPPVPGGGHAARELRAICLGEGGGDKFAASSLSASLVLNIKINHNFKHYGDFVVTIRNLANNYFGITKQIARTGK